MLLIPAIAIRVGKCVNAPAKPAHAKILLPDDPVQVAADWVKAGARRLHVTDLDSGVGDKTSGAEVIRALIAACPGIPIQVSGNLRNDAVVEQYFAAGAEYLILDTKAASTPHFVNDLCLEYPGHILVALEAKHGKLLADGWSKLAQHTLQDVAEHFQREGVAGILYRAASDGKQHTDFAPALSLLQVLNIPVLVSGGLASFEDVRKLCLLGADLSGGVLETGLVNGALDFAKAQKLVDKSVVAS